MNHRRVSRRYALATSQEFKEAILTANLNSRQLAERFPDLLPGRDNLDGALDILGTSIIDAATLQCHSALRRVLRSHRGRRGYRGSECQRPFAQA